MHFIASEQIWEPNIMSPVPGAIIIPTVDIIVAPVKKLGFEFWAVIQGRELVATFWSKEMAERKAQELLKHTGGTNAQP